MPHPPVTLEFQSTLRASRTEIWNWITDITCLRKEMMPFLRMTAPRGVARLTDVQVTLGKPLFRSWILYFGVLPLDYSKVTLLSFAFEQGFVEQSPMVSMRVCSLKLTRYGMQRKPGVRRLRHLRTPGLHCMPPRAA